uniref:Uncharacterized protein n=1 Tax=Anguilla anguilla TaxID=7936 RepID=A0A0E9QQS8_ANGAN
MHHETLQGSLQYEGNVNTKLLINSFTCILDSYTYGLLTLLILHTNLGLHPSSN